MGLVVAVVLVAVVLVVTNMADLTPLHFHFTSCHLMGGVLLLLHRFTAPAPAPVLLLLLKSAHVDRERVVQQPWPVPGTAEHCWAAVFRPAPRYPVRHQLIARPMGGQDRGQLPLGQPIRKERAAALVWQRCAQSRALEGGSSPNCTAARLPAINPGDMDVFFFFLFPKKGPRGCYII